MEDIKTGQKNTLENIHSPLIQSLLKANNIAVCFFDKTAKINAYSVGFEKLLRFRKDFFMAKNLSALPFSKIEEMLGFPAIEEHLSDSQTFKDVKFINGNGQINNIDVHLTITREGEEMAGGSLLLEKSKSGFSEEKLHQNLLTKSEYYLREPLRIASVFAKMLEDNINADDKANHEEYIFYVSKNLKKLNQLLNHLIVLENLNYNSLKISNINTEVLWLLELQKIKETEGIEPPTVCMNEYPENISGDKPLLRKMLKLILEFASCFHNESGKKFIEFSGEEFEEHIKLYFVLPPLNFINHPKFNSSLPLHKVIDINNLPISGYELVLIEQIAATHGGNLNIKTMKNGNSLIQISLPR